MKALDNLSPGSSVNVSGDHGLPPNKVTMDHAGNIFLSRPWSEGELASFERIEALLGGTSENPKSTPNA